MFLHFYSCEMQHEPIYVAFEKNIVMRWDEIECNEIYFTSIVNWSNTSFCGVK